MTYSPLRFFHASARFAPIVFLAAAGLALGGCDRSQPHTAGSQVGTAIDEAQRAASDAAAKTGQAAQEAGAKAGQAVDDAGITLAVSARLAKDPDLSAVQIDVDTQGGKVTLNGPAPNAVAKARAEEIAKEVNGVVAVDNRLEIRAM